MSQESCKKILQDNFLATFDQILQENNLTIFSCKNFVSCKKRFIFSAKLARFVQDFVQDLVSLARKILARFAYFLQDGFYLVASN